MLSSDRVHLFEEHSSALPVWWSHRDKPRTLVCLDAHLNLQPVAPRAIADLQSCTTLDEFRALEAPHYLETSPDYAFGIENVLYAAHRLDLVERLVWVAPPNIPRTYTHALIDYLQQLDGIEFDELTGFELTGPNILRGKLNSLDVTICDYNRLGALRFDDDYILDIDIDYFVRVPEDRLWIEPAMVISKIVDQLGEPSLVTISRGVDSGFTPLAFRFVGDYLYSRFCRHSEQFKYYWRLSSAIQKLSRGKVKTGRKICRDLIEANPENAAAWYLLALVSTDRGERCRLLAGAASRDEKYRPDPGRDSLGLLHRNKPLEPAQLQRMMQRLENSELQQRERCLADSALARTLATAGLLPEAEQLLARQCDAHAYNEDVLLALTANRIKDENRYQQNRDLLTRICEGHRNLAAANMCLGDLEAWHGNYEAALDHYRIAHERAPARMPPLKSLLTAYQQLLMQREYDQIKLQIRKRESRVRELLE